MAVRGVVQISQLLLLLQKSVIVDLLLLHLMCNTANIISGLLFKAVFILPVHNVLLVTLPVIKAYLDGADLHMH